MSEKISTSCGNAELTAYLGLIYNYMQQYYTNQWQHSKYDDWHTNVYKEQMLAYNAVKSSTGLSQSDFGYIGSSLNTGTIPDPTDASDFNAQGPSITCQTCIQSVNISGNTANTMSVSNISQMMSCATKSDQITGTYNTQYAALQGIVSKMQALQTQYSNSYKTYQSDINLANDAKGQSQINSALAKITADNLAMGSISSIGSQIKSLDSEFLSTLNSLLSAISAYIGTNSTAYCNGNCPNLNVTSPAELKSTVSSLLSASSVNWINNISSLWTTEQGIASGNYSQSFSAGMATAIKSLMAQGASNGEKKLSAGIPVPTKVTSVSINLLIIIIIVTIAMGLLSGLAIELI